MAKVDKFDLPDDLYYHKEFMWVRLLENGTAQVGVTDFYQDKAGEFNYIDQPEKGDDLSQDELVGMVETGKWIGRIYSPLTGTVTKANDKIQDEPSIVNSSPYQDGWLFEMSIDDKSELDNLFFGQEAIKWQTDEIENPHQN